MTRPEQPQEYPGSPAELVQRTDIFTPSRLYRVYGDLIGRHLTGRVIVRNERDQSLVFDVPDGVLDVNLNPGRYRIIADLRDAEGNPAYSSEVVDL